MLNYETSCINVQIKGIFKYYKFITSWKRLKYSIHKQKQITSNRKAETLVLCFFFYERKIYER